MVMLNWALRYAPVVKFLGPIQGTILEVGSGDRGLAEFIAPRPCIGVDLNFSQDCSPNLIPVRASALALPFPDAAFDCVVSLDMLEHVAQVDRASAINELVRVTGRYLIVGFPSGEAAFKSDRRVSAFLGLFGKSPDWLQEHLSMGGHPTVEIVQEVIGERARLVKRMTNANAVLHALVTIGDHLPIVGWLFQRIARIDVVALVAPILNVGTTYRLILFYEKRETEPILGANVGRSILER